MIRTNVASKKPADKMREALRIKPTQRIQKPLNVPAVVEKRAGLLGKKST